MPAPQLTFEVQVGTKAGYGWLWQTFSVGWGYKAAETAREYYDHACVDPTNGNRYVRLVAVIAQSPDYSEENYIAHTETLAFDWQEVQAAVAHLSAASQALDDPTLFDRSGAAGGDHEKPAPAGADRDGPDQEPANRLVD